MRRAVLFDVGGPIDMEFAYEIAVEGAIAAACGMEGIRLDQSAIDEASERAVEAFAPDAHAHMIETLCGDPRTVERVRQRVHAMVANLDVFQLRPGIDDLLRKLRKLDLGLGLIALVGAATYAFHGEVRPGAAAVVGLPAALGAVFGTGLQQRLRGRTLSLGFAALLAGIAIWLLV